MKTALEIVIINGPNLNLLGKREQSIYGNQDFESYFNTLVGTFPGLELRYFQSNIEGEIIDLLHKHGFSAAGILLNAGGYTHTSVAIADAVAAIQTPVVEIHISNVYAREEYRHESKMAGKCKGVIAGFGLDSYRLGLEALLHFFGSKDPSNS